MKKIQEVSGKYLKKIYICMMKVILIILYFFILDFFYGNENVNIEFLEEIIKIIAMVFLFRAIYIFEKAYKKDNEELAVQGIELLIFSIYMITARYMTNRFNLDNYSFLITCVYSIYFVLKTIFTYMKGIKELSGNLSDVRQIVKKEKPIKKEATKRVKEMAEK